MKIIKNGTTIWGVDYVVNITQFLPVREKENRFKFTIYFNNGDIVTETRKSNLNLMERANAIPTIELMLKEYDMSKENI